VNRLQCHKQHGESIENQLRQLGNVDATSLVNALDVAGFLCKEMHQPMLDDHMNEWLGRQKGSGVRLELLFRASRDGFKATDFHRLCDNKEATVTVIRSKQGYEFGGYADQSWHSSNGCVESSSAFLFSLLRPLSSVAMKLPLNGTNNHKAMFCGSSQCPVFGGGHDILVYDSSNTNSSSCFNLGYSYTLPDGIKVGKTFFTGAYNFQASEVEVFRVVG
jgi:hypothetical protein